MGVRSSIDFRTSQSFLEGVPTVLWGFYEGIFWGEVVEGTVVQASERFLTVVGCAFCVKTAHEAVLQQYSEEFTRIRAAAEGSAKL